MSARSEELAKKVEEANNQLLKAIEDSTADQWAAKCSDGEWSQEFAAWHAAESIPMVTSMCQAVALGQPIPPVSLDDVNKGNEASWKSHTSKSTDEAAALVRSGGPKAAEFVRGLTDEQLDRTANLLVGMPPVSAQQAIEFLLIGHPAGHTETLVKVR